MVMFSLKHHFLVHRCNLLILWVDICVPMNQMNQMYLFFYIGFNDFMIIVFMYA